MSNEYSKGLAVRMAEAIDCGLLVDAAAARVAAMFPYGSSTDGMDYAYSAAQCLAELMSIVRDSTGGDSVAGLATWFSVPVGFWYASDGDIRFDLDALVTDAALAGEWVAFVDSIYDEDTELCVLGCGNLSDHAGFPCDVCFEAMPISSPGVVCEFCAVPCLPTGSGVDSAGFNVEVGICERCCRIAASVEAADELASAIPTPELIWLAGEVEFLAGLLGVK